MGMTMIEKILARRAGLEVVKVGDLVVCDVDKAVHLDLSFAVDGMDVMPKRIDNPERLVVVLDHAVPSPGVIFSQGHIRAREFVKKFKIKNFFDVGHHGIVHQVIYENGFALPGQILACTDSHTCASGAFNCAARGVGPTEMLQISCIGKTWYKVAPTIKFLLEGEKPPNVSGKDVFLYIAGMYGSAEGFNVEFDGSGLKSLPLNDRATIATMCAEISVEFALFPADELVINYLLAVTRETFEPVESDPDAHYAAIHTIDLSTLKPYVAKPDFVPNNTLAVRELGEKVRIQQAFVGSCANGKLEDLRIAAAIVKGKKVAHGVRFIVTPASQKVYKEAVRQGYVEALLEAGAVVTNSTCGACYGGHMGLLGPDEVCVTSSTRNFKGRMGSPSAKIYIASSATVAASAVAGYIVEDEPFLEGAVNI